MIARIWQGKTPLSKFEEYTQFVKDKAIPDYQSVPGNLGLTFLRKVDGQAGTFMLISYWDSVESIKNFAGEDHDKAKYYPEDSKFLLHFEEKVQHFEVFYKD